MIGLTTGTALEGDNDWQYEAHTDKQLLGPFLEGEGFDPGRDEEYIPWDFDRDGDLDPPEGDEE